MLLLLYSWIEHITESLYAPKRRMNRVISAWLFIDLTLWLDFCCQFQRASLPAHWLSFLGSRLVGTNHCMPEGTNSRH